MWLSQLLAMAGLTLGALDACIVSSVVPQSIFNLRNLARRYLKTEPLIVGENVELGVPVRIAKPREAGADRIHACFTHAVLSGKACEQLRDSEIEQVVTTNTIPLRDEACRLENIKVLSIAPLLAKAIKSIHEETSVSSLFV